MKIVSIVVSTSLLLMSGASFAQSEPMTPAKSTAVTQHSDKTEMNKADTLTAEKQKAASEHFTKLDTNKDGKLSASEFGAMPNRSKDFGTLDADKDGSLTTIEFSKYKMQ